MTLFKYNCSNIIVVATMILALCYVVYKILKKFNKVNCSEHVAKLIIVGIIITGCMFSSIFIWETDIGIQEGTVTDYVRMGSRGDYIVNYTFCIVDDKGKEMSYSTPLLSSKKYTNKLDNINRNDKILIKYGKKFHSAFDIEKIE